MDSRAQRHPVVVRPKVRVAIFGAGKVGTAMSLEMPGVPLLRRGEDVECEVACVCWPAHAIQDFSSHHPLAARGTKVAFCNGAWAVEDGADHHGVCYVRIARVGDRSSEDDGRNGWRVGDEKVCSILRGAGLGVIQSLRAQQDHVWAKALYLLPLALACFHLREIAKEVVNTSVHRRWYEAVRDAACEDIGEARVQVHEARVWHLLSRLPRDWYPSPSKQELAYFRERLVSHLVEEA